MVKQLIPPLWISEIVGYCARRLNKWKHYSSNDWSRWRPFQWGPLFTYRKWCGTILPSLAFIWGHGLWIELGQIFYDGWGFDIRLWRLLTFKWCPGGHIEHWLKGNIIFRVFGFKIVQPIEKTYAGIETNRVVSIRPGYHGNECVNSKGSIFYTDWKGAGIKAGDMVQCERLDSGFYKRIWVNGGLISNDNFNELHSDTKTTPSD